MNEQIPKISIVTPSFNQASFLEATIQSVLSQNYPNLEYIIIDGGSTDGSLEIIKQYEKQLHFWCSEPDQGHYDAINKGFAHSSGEIMAWLNSDDMYFPFALKTVSSIMANFKQLEWLTTLSPASWDWHGFCTGFSSIPGYSRDAFLDGYYSPWCGKWIGWIQQESTFWRRSLWEKAGSCIRTEFSFAGDFDLWSRFFLHADLYGTPSPLGGFRFRFDQRVRQGNYYALEASKSLAEMRDSVNWVPDYSRSLALQLKFNRIPGIRKLIREKYGFTGKRVIRSQPEKSDSYWKIEEYKFP